MKVDDRLCLLARCEERIPLARVQRGQSQPERVLGEGHGLESALRIAADICIYTNQQIVLESGTDGMKLDEKGNLYLTTRGAVVIVTAEGKPLGTIHLPVVLGVPPTTTNVAFGDADRKTLYIAARTHLYRIRLNVAGPRPVQPR